MEEASGRDLSGFFQQWLYQGGSLEYEGSWSFDPESGTIEVELNQVQDDGYSFRMPVQLGIYVEGNSEPRIEILNVDHMSNRFTISVDRESAAVVLDPNMWVLMDADFRRRN